MFYFLLVLLILDGLVLSAVVLAQAGQGGGLAALGGGMTDKAMGGRHATTFLTKATWITGGGLLVLSLLLSLMSGSQGGRAASAVQQQLQQEAPATAPTTLPGIEPPPAPPTPPGN